MKRGERLLPRQPGVHQNRRKNEANTVWHKHNILKYPIHFLLYFSWFQRGYQAEQELQSTTMAIFIISENKSFLHQPKDIGIVIDAMEVLNELASVSATMAMLFGLIQRDSHSSLRLFRRSCWSLVPTRCLPRFGD